MMQIFSVPAEIEFASLRNATADVRRVFYYDCLNDIQKDGESDADFKNRVDTQQVLFDKVQSLDGFHVRLGSLSGTRKKLRQKKVDVLLVVEALDHAFRGNMSRICLIAGDLDFAPLVDSLIRLGTYVQILYSPKSAARGLYIAADMGQPITFNHVYGWSTAEFRARHPIPAATSNELLPPQLIRAAIRSGVVDGKPISLYQVGNQYMLHTPKYDSYSLSVRYTDLDFLERYFGLVYGPITWDSTSSSTSE